MSNILQWPDIPRSVNIYGLYFILTAPAILLAIFGDWHGDAAWSYRDVAKNSVFELIRYQPFNAANNQIINSLYFKLLISLDVKHVFVFRFLSLSGLFLFIWSTVQILKLNRINRLYIFVLTIGPYYEYFALGRGYGLAMGLFSFSFYSFLKYVETKDMKWGFWFIICGSLATISIFSFLFGFLSLLALYFLSSRKEWINYKILIQLLIVSTTMAYVYYAGSIINEFDLTIVGSDNLIKNGTISSLFYDLSGYKYLQSQTLRILAILSTCITFLLVASSIKRLSIDQKKIIFLFLAIFLLTFASMMSANLLFGAKYPIVRSVMYLEYLLIFFLVVSATIIRTKAKYLSIITIFLISFSILTIRSLDLSLLSNRDILLDSNGKPIVYSTPWNSISFESEIHGIGNTDNIYEVRNLSDMQEVARAHSQSEIWVITRNEELIKHFQSKKTKIRNQEFLIKVSPGTFD